MVGMLPLIRQSSQKEEVTVCDWMPRMSDYLPSGLVATGPPAAGTMCFPRGLFARKGRSQMLYYALVFLVIAIVAGILGFGGIAGVSVSIAQFLVFLFVVMLVLSLIARMFPRSR